jgi:hypothetical protein
VRAHGQTAGTAVAVGGEQPPGHDILRRIRGTGGPARAAPVAARRRHADPIQADAERDIRGFAVKFYTEAGNWDLVGNNTPVFFLRDPLKFPDLNHAVKRDPRTNLRNARNNWDFWTISGIR